MSPFLFYPLAAITCIFAVGVVVSRNIVRSAAWLLFTLAGVAGIFFLLGSDFVGTTQLLVYVGGTLVLVVFGVMLTAQGPLLQLKISGAEWLISTTVGVTLFALLAFCLVLSPVPMSKESSDLEKIESVTLGQSLLGLDGMTPCAQLTGVEKSHPDRKPMTYLLPFEIVSVHLLVVLIGAAYLARAKRRKGQAA